MLNTDLETVCWLIVKLREFEIEDALPVEPADDDESLSPDAPNAAEESHALAEREEDHAAPLPEDPIYTDVKRIVDDLNEDAQIELVALAWMGRGDYSDIQDWPTAVRDARARHNGKTAEYLLGMPMVSDHLEQGLSQLGLSCDGTAAWSI